jgi:riboflavin biosynthesis pyrimidine reductase
MQFVWYAALSLDGRLAEASPAGDRLDFLESFADPAAEAADYPDFLASVDAIVVGAGTVRWLLAGGHGWPYADKATWVVTHDDALMACLREACEGQRGARLRQVAGPLDGLRVALEAEGFERVWLCGGGDVAGQLLRCDALDTLVLTTAPVAVGSGPSLFGPGPLPAPRFALEACRPYAGNGLRTVWRRDRPGA